MSGTIRFDNVWKRFHRGPAHDSLRDLIPALLHRATPGKREERTFREGDFWAVRDVSFEVQPGRVLGIIGGNGAGKSTILKLLTKVLAPNRGRAQVDGRIGALIEVAAGFHGDLSGRENIFLQGAIMAMPQRLIRERFDDIVDFSGIAESIDTPVKRYSTGMSARLGFAIAVHLEPDALIIDEVLSVGDAEFQERAFNRIRGMVSQNVPVVLVSHQLDRIVELCSDCILLRQGQVLFRGEPEEAVHQYLHGGGDLNAHASGAPAGISLLELTGPATTAVKSGETCTFRLDGDVTDATACESVLVAIRVIDAASRQQLFISDLRHIDAHPTAMGRFAASFELQANVPPGLLRVETLLWDGQRGKEVGHGPGALLRVEPGIPFAGSHQLNIRKGAMPP